MINEDGRQLHAAVLLSFKFYPFSFGSFQRMVQIINAKAIKHKESLGRKQSYQRRVPRCLFFPATTSQLAHNLKEVVVILENILLSWKTRWCAREREFLLSKLLEPVFEKWKEPSELKVAKKNMVSWKGQWDNVLFLWRFAHWGPKKIRKYWAENDTFSVKAWWCKFLVASSFSPRFTPLARPKYKYSLERPRKSREAIYMQQEKNMLLSPMALSSSKPMAKQWFLPPKPIQ